MLQRDYLIIGAGIGAGSVCESLRRNDRRGSVTVIGNEPYPPYHRPRLFPMLLSQKLGTVDKILHLKDEWYRKNKIELRLDTRVKFLNIERRIAVLETGQAFEFKKACLATGSRAKRPQVAGANLGNVVYVRGIRDVNALREMAEHEKNVVVIGGGFIAAETASYLRQLKMHITLMSRHVGLWGKFLDPDTAAWLTKYYQKKGVTMMMGESLNGFEGKTVLRNVQTKSGNRFVAGLALVAVGAEPNLDLVANTPLSTPAGTPVNEYLETDEKGIFAAGDIALYPDPIFGGLRRTEHWENAVAQGRIAGQNITGKKRQKFRYVPCHSSMVFDLHFDFVGDFSRAAGRVELIGDRAKKKFIARYHTLNQLTGIVLCNQDKGKVDKARAEFLAGS